ncbi:MAG TPA: porin [Candidatus Kapabacteria bacterium]|nr:porin [Candidatus Kapabacteria bacterium]
MKLLPYYLGLSVLGVGIASPAVLAQGASNPANDALLKRIEELEQQVKVLGRKDEIADEAAVEKAKTAVSVSAGASGFQIRSADTNFVLKIRGYLQADSRWFIDDEGSSATSNDTFLLRRVRPIFEGTVFDKFDYRLMLDFGSGVTANNANNAYVQDAYVNARLLPEFQIQGGKFKEPVGLERLQSGANLLFVERAYPTQLLPNRDVGFQLQGDIGSGLLSYAVGAFNGVADGGSGDIDRTDDEKDIAARIFAHPFKDTNIEALQGLGIGVAGTYGNQFGTPRSYVTPGQQTFFSYLAGTGTNAVANTDGTVWRLSPQAYWYWRSLGVLAEYAISSSEVARSGGGVTANDRLQHSAWQVAASYFLTGEDNSFKAVTPLKPFSLGGDGWGAWEIAARVSQLKLDDDTFPLYANPNTSASEAISYAGGVNWHLNRNFKVNLNYEHTDFDGGASNPLLAEGEDVILTRAQISF